jgi:hypothetical protein
MDKGPGGPDLLDDGAGVAAAPAGQAEATLKVPAPGGGSHRQSRNSMGRSPVDD